MDVDIETIIDIKCADFYEQFKGDIFKKEIKTQKEIDNFLQLLEQLKSDQTGRSIDTRAKVLIKYKSFTDTICADRFELTYKQNSFEMSDELRSVIWSSDTTKTKDH